MRNIQNRHKAHEFIHNSQASEKTEKSTFKVPDLGSRVPPLGSWVSGPTHEIGPGFRVLGHTFRVPELESRVSPMRWVPGLGSHQKSRVLGPLFG